MEINSDSSKSLAQAMLSIVLIDKIWSNRQSVQHSSGCFISCQSERWRQYCQNWPIRGYTCSSSRYTRRGSLKKFLQALPPLLALVLPHFFLARFRSFPTTESLEQANKRVHIVACTLNHLLYTFVEQDLVNFRTDVLLLSVLEKAIKPWKEPVNEQEESFNHEFNYIQ